MAPPVVALNRQHLSSTRPPLFATQSVRVSIATSARQGRALRRSYAGVIETALGLGVAFSSSGPAQKAAREVGMSSSRTAEGSDEMIQVGAMEIRFRVESADSNGSVSVFECFVPANSRMPAPHSHDAFEETIYGLEGVTSWTVDGRAVEIAVGDVICVPRGAVHGFQNARAPRRPHPGRRRSPRVIAVRTPPGAGERCTFAETSS
jgi:quercetin dioxygenase-like cupin family protein